MSQPLYHQQTINSISEAYDIHGNIIGLAFEDAVDIVLSPEPQTLKRDMSIMSALGEAGYSKEEREEFYISAIEVARDISKY